MKESQEALQRLFFELPETISLEELMEVKGGNIPPPICGVEGSGIVCPSGSAITCNGSTAL